MPRTTNRTAALRKMLMERRRKAQDDVYGHLRDARAHGVGEVRDDADVANSDIQDDGWLAVLQMRAESAVGIDAALRRLDAGQFGYCADCRKEISERRLGAMPFSARCHACEQRREDQRADQPGRRGSHSLFPDPIGP